jgi:hypothetical protein
MSGKPNVLIIHTDQHRCDCLGAVESDLPDQSQYFDLENDPHADGKGEPS